jgi:uncharacterized protein
MQEAKPKFVFNCQRCGRCCEQDVAVFLSDIEEWSRDGTIYQVFPELSISDDLGILSIRIEREDGKCKMFDLEKKECKIYDHRPVACRAYPLKHDGSGFLLRDKECPGLNVGEMSREALEEIRTSAREEYDEGMSTVSVLPVLQALLMKDVAKKSEEAYSKLTDEEKAELEKILKKET